ncbi:MAG: divalent-cation tolerance protein CutA [Betaproteobacteria bacterium]
MPHLVRLDAAAREFNKPWICTRMTSDIGALIVITTVPDENLAVKISESLLQQRLAACVHALPAGLSRFRWQGNIECLPEITLLIKSTVDRYQELEAVIRRLHSYETPEIVAFPVRLGLPAYLDWVVNETR